MTTPFSITAPYAVPGPSQQRNNTVNAQRKTATDLCMILSSQSEGVLRILYGFIIAMGGKYRL
jgi:hypothetical protein